MIQTAIFTDGSHGQLLSAPLPTDPDAMAEVLLDSGQRLFLLLDALTPHEESGYNVDLSRVEINEFVENPPPVRYEGNVMIIPILEEVLVVEKRLRLKEEVYIMQVQTECHEPQSGGASPRDTFRGKISSRKCTINLVSADL
ncbi:MAG: DUF2382 domain-containing protein [Janthinobacterium lividum]